MGPFSKLGMSQCVWDVVHDLPELENIVCKEKKHLHFSNVIRFPTTLQNRKYKYQRGPSAIAAGSISNVYTFIPAEKASTDRCSDE